MANAESNEVHNLHITGFEHLPTPDELRQEFALQGKLLPQFIRRGQVLKPCDVQIMNLIALCVCHSDSDIRKAGIMG